jgi:hypothetical protein
MQDVDITHIRYYHYLKNTKDTGMQQVQPDFTSAHLEVIVEIIKNQFKQPSIWIYIIAGITLVIILRRLLS